MRTSTGPILRIRRARESRGVAVQVFAEVGVGENGVALSCVDENESIGSWRMFFYRFRRKLNFLALPEATAR